MTGNGPRFGAKVHPRIPFSFLRAAARLGCVLWLTLAAGARAETSVAPAPERNNAHLTLSPVIISERPDAMQGYDVDPAQVRQMLAHCLQVLTSAGDVATAWTRLGVRPGDIVGIKVTTACGPNLCTHPALVKAICDGLQAAGLPRSHIIIWDRYPDKMRPAGYLLRPASADEAAVDAVAPNNYDPDVYYSSGIVGQLIWGDFQFSNSLNPATFDPEMLRRSYYTKFFTQTCTKIINVPVLTHNETYGIEGCISSVAFGSTDNNIRFQGPPTYADPMIDEIYDQGFIRHKVIVHILDALVAQCAGAPSFNPIFCRQWGALYVGRDPVAIDSLALPRLERMRRDVNVPTTGNMSTYLTSAAVLGIGTTDRHRIQFLRVP